MKNQYYGSNSAFEFHESPVLSPSPTTIELEEGYRETIPNHLSKKNPKFHLLVTNSLHNAGLCKTILSAAILDYPPPTLINFKPKTALSSNDIEGVHRYLHKENNGIGDDDLVLIVDGGHTWFQLPSSIMIHRYQSQLLAEGLLHDDNDANHHVIFGARKSCLLENPSDPACNAVPISPMGRDSARHLDAGVLVGHAGDIKKIYGAARVDPVSGQTFEENMEEVMSAMFGLQEIRRGAVGDYGYSAKFKAWVTDKANNQDDGSDNDSGIRLDYVASLFQTSAQSDRDMVQVVHRVHETLQAGKNKDGSSDTNSTLPPDLASSGPPVRPAIIDRPHDDKNTSTLAYNETIDTLPEVTWADLSLATNLNMPSIPALLHFDGDIYHRQNFADPERWKQMWFHPYARALMRNAVRGLEGSATAHAAAVGSDRLWDTRGGQGGVWTHDGNWIDFGDLCRGFEHELFDDGMGEWGYEGGPHPRCSKDGKLIAGHGECDQPED